MTQTTFRSMKSQILIPIILLTLFGCQGVRKPEEQAQAEIPVVRVAKAVEISFSPEITFVGTVYANRESNLGAALPGKVERIFFAEGARVKQGDLIVELADEMLTQAEVENQALRKDFERVSRLREKESVSQMEFDHLKAKLEASDAKTEMVRMNTRVYAPFSGTIVERMMEEGEIYFINPGLDPGYSMRSGIVRLMQLDPVKVKFDVNEKVLSLIKPGLEANISVDVYPDKHFVARVSRVKPMLSTLTRTAPAEIVVNNPNGELKPGMFARVSLSLPEQNSVFVPISSIGRLLGTGEEFVYVVEKGVAQRVVVSRVHEIGDRVAVTGIKPGQAIITDGKAKVQDGQMVDVRK